jgi:hypothetical protein
MPADSTARWCPTQSTTRRPLTRHSPGTSALSRAHVLPQQAPDHTPSGRSARDRRRPVSVRTSSRQRATASARRRGYPSDCCMPRRPWTEVHVYARVWLRHTGDGTDRDRSVSPGRAWPAFGRDRSGLVLVAERPTRVDVDVSPRSPAPMMQDPDGHPSPPWGLSANARSVYIEVQGRAADRLDARGRRMVTALLFASRSAHPAPATRHRSCRATFLPAGASTNLTPRDRSDRAPEPEDRLAIRSRARSTVLPPVLPGTPIAGLPSLGPGRATVQTRV